MEDQGIMSLPQAGMQAPTTAPTQYPMGEAAITAFEQARSQMDPKEFGTELLSAAEQTDPAAVQEFKAALQNLNLPPEIIDALNQMIDLILANPQDYAEIRKMLLEQGVPEDLLPANFDPSFFGALNLALDQMAGSTMPMGTQQFANGGIVSLKPIAAMLAAQGRNGDTMLAHITPAEARLLRRYGGSGTINPVTGLPEFFLKKIGKAISNTVKSVGNAVGGAFKAVGKAVSGVVKSVASAVKKFASSTVGKIVTTVALGFFLGPAAAGMLGVTSAAGVAAVSGFIGGAGSTLLAGGKLKDAIKAGAIGGLTAGAGAGIMGGANAFQAGSYVGPTTVAGQVESFTNSLKSLGGAPTNAAGTSLTTPDQLNASVNSIDAAAGVPISAPPAATAITPPEFVATASRGVDVASAGPVSGVGPISGTSVPAGVSGSYAPFADQVGGAGVGPTSIPPSFAPGMPGAEAAQMFGSGPAGFESFAGIEGGAGAAPARSFTDMAKGAYQEYIRPYTPTGIEESGREAALAEYNKVLSATNDPTLARQAYNKALPGMFAKYAPVVAAGTGAAYLAGAFNPTEPKPPGIVPRETGFDLIRQNPAEYGVNVGQTNTIYAGGPSGYGQMGELFAPPQFRVRDPREYLPRFFTGGAVRKLLNSAAIKRAVGEENPQVAASANTPTTRSAVVSPETDKFGRPLPPPVPIENLRPELMPIRRSRPTLGPFSFDRDRLAGISNNPVPPGFGTTPPTAVISPAVSEVPVDRRRFMGYGAPSQFRNAPNFMIRNPGEYLPQGLAALLQRSGLAAVAPRQFNMGGFASGGQNFPRRTGPINGPGTGTSDSIPAMLSDGEFVMTAKAVRGAGGGSRREGAKRMYQMMRKFERKA